MKATLDVNFWKGFKDLGIYGSQKSSESSIAGLADQAPAGGTQGSDMASGSEQINDESSQMNLDANPPDQGAGVDAMGADPSLAGGGGDPSGMGGDMASSGGPEGAGGQEEESDPNENMFKGPNGKSLLDTKLAELQAAVMDSLQRLQGNTKIDTVVVSELENLLDSVKKVRETVYLVPVENTLYKYRLSTVSYALLSKDICIKLSAEQN